MAKLVNSDAFSGSLNDVDDTETTARGAFILNDVPGDVRLEGHSVRMTSCHTISLTSVFE